MGHGWSSTQALGPRLRCAIILRGAEWHDDDTYTLRCAWCGREVGREVELDHVVATCDGGSDKADNLVPSCPDCNAFTEDRRTRKLTREVRWQLRQPVSRELRRMGQLLAEGWYPWFAESTRKNREAQRRRDDARRGRRVRVLMRDVRARAQRRKAEDAAWRALQRRAA